MNTKIPTPIIDKNGKHTTVHKNPESVSSQKTRVGNVAAPPVAALPPKMQGIIGSTYRNLSSGETLLFESVYESDIPSLPNENNAFYAAWVIDKDGNEKEVLFSSDRVDNNSRINGWTKLSEKLDTDNASLFFGFEGSVNLSLIGKVITYSEMVGILAEYFETPIKDIKGHNFVISGVGAKSDIKTWERILEMEIMGLDDQKYKLKIPMNEDTFSLTVDVSRRNWDEYKTEALKNG